jgi:3-oxoacyl-[acyl-carrier protein] reductase
MTNKLDFSGRTVLVVGGTSGIGNGIACGFRDAGAKVFVWGTRASLADYEGESGNDYDRLGFSQMDVSDPDAVASYAAPFEVLDVLVLSQGDSLMSDGASEYGMQKFARVFDLNVTSFMSCSARFKDLLTVKGGSIIMLSSIAARMAIPTAPAYCASKHAITGLCQSLAKAWAANGVRVNAIGPGVVPSRMAKAVTENPEYLQAVIARNPMGRLGTVREMADAALFLASPMASYITGQTLFVDGGHTLFDTL